MAMSDANYAVGLADSYRGYSAALRLVSRLPMEDLMLRFRIADYLWHVGHEDILKLMALPTEEYCAAFDLSRAKKRRAA